MYKTFQDLMLHASNKALYFVEECEKATELDKAIELYCLGMAFLNKHHIKDLKDWYGVTSLGADYSAHFDEVNNALHLMHEREPQLRSEAAENYWLYIEENLELHREFNICAEELKLHAGDSVPEDVQNVIRQVLKPIEEDICVSITATWLYSHINMGLKYDYSRPENIYIEIYSYAEETLSLIDEEYEKKVRAAVEEYLRRK